jgi:hypothetical protein
VYVPGEEKGYSSWGKYVLRDGYNHDEKSEGHVRYKHVVVEVALSEDMDA